jgi:hypothetical protein
MRLLELIEGADGKLDEQAALLIIFGLTFVGLTIYKVVCCGAPFIPMDFAIACGAFAGGSIGSLTLRSRFSKDSDNADPSQRGA